MYLNKAIIYGNLTRDPELRALPSGIQVASFSIATNRVWKDKNGMKQESVDYHNVVCFGRQAELVSQYLHKGSSAMIEVRMQTRSWEAEGGKKYRTEIVADKIQFGPKGFGGGSGAVPSEGSPASSKSKPAGDDEGGKTIEYPEEEINLEDIPF